VIATSSVAGLKAYPTTGVYCGTKWFVRAFMEVLRWNRPTKARTSAYCHHLSAAINTELLDTISHDGVSAGMRAVQPICIAPERVADVVAYALNLPADTIVSSPSARPTSPGESPPRDARAWLCRASR
jgi:NADP-dependent 3-hydroxy acid dehydrogenase YdfG